MKFKTRSATALLILTAVVAACGAHASTTSPGASQASGPAATTAPGASTAPAASTAAVSGCTLITEQDATSLLGADPGPGVDMSSDGSPACAYGASLTFGVESGDAKAQYDARKAAMEGSGKAQEMTGVGDAGFVFIVANTVAQMEILKGSTLLTVNVQGDPSLQNITLATLTALGTTAIGRL